jgi:hypothetical protein
MMGRPKAVRSTKKMVGASDYTAKPGTCTWLNGAYWVEVVTERPDGLVVVANCGDVGKKTQESIQKALERDSVFPLLRGQDVSRWRATPSLSIVLAQDPKRPSVGISEAELRKSRPHTYEYFLRFEAALRCRSGYVKYLGPNGAPFYAIYNIGPYTFSSWKVVWREQASFLTCAVVGPADHVTIVPDHKLMLIPCSSANEAHFICGVLSSSVAAYMVASYAVETSVSTHVLKYLPVPRYCPKTKAHLAISETCKLGHKAAAAEQQDTVSECEATINELAAELWGLSKAESKDIQDSLEDLKS